MNNIIDKIIVVCLGKIFKHDIGEEQTQTIIQFAKFCVVGLTNTLISYLLNIFILLLLTPVQLTWDYVIGNVVSFVLSVLWSFYWNNRFVFTENELKERNMWEVLGKTYIVYGITGIFLNNVLSWIWIQGLSISKYIAPICNLIITMPINFIMNKLWAFKR